MKKSIISTDLAPAPDGIAVTGKVRFVVTVERTVKGGLKAAELVVLAMSYRSAKPPRRAVLLFPVTSQAKPTRGPKLRSDGFL